MVLATRVVTAGSGVVFVLLTARHLGPIGRGEITVAFTIAYVTANFSSLGTTTSGPIRLLAPNDPVGTNDVWSLTVALVPLQAALATGAVYVLSQVALHLEARFMLSVVGLSVATMVFRGAVSMLYGLRRYRTVMVGETGLAVVQVVAVVLLFRSARLTSTSAVLVMAVGMFACAGWLVGQPGVLGRGGGRPVWTHWKSLIRDGISPMVGGVLFFSAMRIDRLILAMFVGAESVGVYTVALAIPETLRILPMAIGQVIAARGRSGIDTLATVKRNGLLALTGHLVVLVLSAAVGWIFLPLAFGEGFRQARDVLVIVTLAEVVLSVHVINQAVQYGFGRVHRIGVPGAVGGVVVVLLDLVMIPAWGMHGAAWAAVAGFAVLSGTSVWWTERDLRTVSTQ
jgi:O-antigen/teichoic acid export membrane protein